MDRNKFNNIDNKYSFNSTNHLHPLINHTESLVKETAVGNTIADTRCCQHRLENIYDYFNNERSCLK